jgi:hypothetical protein
MRSLFAAFVLTLLCVGCLGSGRKVSWIEVVDYRNTAHRVEIRDPQVIDRVMKIFDRRTPEPIKFRIMYVMIVHWRDGKVTEVAVGSREIKAEEGSCSIPEDLGAIFEKMIPKKEPNHAPEPTAPSGRGSP